MLSPLEIVLIATSIGVFVWDAVWLFRNSLSKTVTPGFRRRVWGAQFLSLGILAWILLKIPFGDSVADWVATALLFIGIGFLVSTKE